MSQEQVIEAIAGWKKRALINKLYRDYYDGNHLMQFASVSFRRHYDWVLANSRENLCEAVVSSFTGPISVQSWQGGGGKTATEFARTLALSKVMNLAHDEAYITGDGYVLTWPDKNGIIRPYVQSSDEIFISVEPGTNTVEWAAKMWITTMPDIERRLIKRARVNIYSDRGVERYYAPGFFVPDEKNDWVMGDLWPEQFSSWVPFDLDGDPPWIPHTFGRCPIHWLPHNQRVLGKHGRSILRNVVPLQDALNHSLATLIVGTEAFSQPLRLLLGVNEEQDQVVTIVNGEIKMADPKGIKIDPTKESIIGVPGDNVRAVQLDPPDATRLITIQDAIALKIARVVGMPAYYLTQMSGDVPSGASLRVLRERMTSEITDFEQDVQWEWAEILNDLGAPDTYPEWAPATPIDPVEKVQIAKVKHDMGYPFEELLIDLGEQPDDILRILKKKDEDRQRQQEQFEQQQLTGLRLLQGNEE